METLTRHAQALWNGSPDHGRGLLSTGSGALAEHHYSIAHRLDTRDTFQTSPEELVGAAIASCFIMALLRELHSRGESPLDLSVTATVTAGLHDHSPQIHSLLLVVEGSTTRTDLPTFEAAARTARDHCAIYQLLAPALASVAVHCHLSNPQEPA